MASRASGCLDALPIRHALRRPIAVARCSSFSSYRKLAIENLVSSVGSGSRGSFCFLLLLLDLFGLLGLCLLRLRLVLLRERCSTLRRDSPNGLRESVEPASVADSSVGFKAASGPFIALVGLCQCDLRFFRREASQSSLYFLRRQTFGEHDLARKFGLALAELAEA